MSGFLEHQAAIWIALGFLLLVIEALAFGFAGILLFGSLGAIATGALLWFSLVPDSFIAAVACFAISTSVITAVLWKPLKRLQSGAELGNDRSSDLIGHSFVLDSDVSESEPGQQKFSGIHWQVKPADKLSGQRLPSGTRVEVTAVSVGIFFVEPVQ